MKMVPHEAIGKRIAYWQDDVFLVQLHEVPIISFLEEDVLPVVAAIEDVVVMTRFKRDVGLHYIPYVARTRPPRFSETSEVCSLVA